MLSLKKNKPLLVILIIQICILILAVGNFILCKSNLYSTTIYPNELNCDSDVVSGDKICANPYNSVEGVFASTTPLELERGSYLVYVNYQTNVDGNRIFATSSDITAHHFQSNPNIFLHKTTRTATLSFRSYTGCDVSIHAQYVGKGSIEISQIMVVETTDMAKQDFLYGVFLCLLINLGYYICTTNLNRRKIILSLAAIILLSSYPLFINYLIVGHDIPFHLNRIDGIKEGLQSGTFPVKIYPMILFDQGYAVGVFYGDTLLYFPALLRIFGMNIQSAYQMFVFVINAATAIISYFCFKKLLRSDKWGLCASMIYTLSTYRLINVYSRGAVGEFSSMMFLPILFLGFYNIYTQEKGKFNWKLAILPAIGLSGIIQTHTLSGIMVGIFIILTCIILITKTLRPQFFFTLLLTLGLTLLLNAGFLVPFIDYYFTEDFIINSSEWGEASIQNYGLFITQIFGLFFDADGPTSSTIYGIKSEFAPVLGITLSIGFFVCIYYLFMTQKEERKNSSFKLIVFTFICATLAIFMASYFFPWDAIANSCKLGTSLVSSIQFPWRFLSMATLFTTICFCQVLKNISEQPNRNHALPFTPIVMILLCISTLISSGWYYYSFIYNGVPYRVYDTYELNSNQIYTCEYLPTDTDLNDITPKRYDISPDVQLLYDESNGTTLLVQVQSNENGGYLEVPLVHYRGYSAVAVESKEELAVSSGFNNYVRVDIPANFNGSIEIAFHEPLHWRISELVSALTLIFLLAIPATKIIKKKKTL